MSRLVKVFKALISYKEVINNHIRGSVNKVVKIGKCIILGSDYWFHHISADMGLGIQFL